MSVAANPSSALKNYLLAALPVEDFVRVKLKLKPVSLKYGEILYKFSSKIDYVYFPTTAIISLLLYYGKRHDRRDWRDRQ